MTVKILVLDGTTFRSHITYNILQILEYVHQDKISNIFDVFCGCHMGSIMAYYLANGMPLHQVSSLSYIVENMHTYHANYYKYNQHQIDEILTSKDSLDSVSKPLLLLNYSNGEVCINSKLNNDKSICSQIGDSFINKIEMFNPSYLTYKYVKDNMQQLLPYVLPNSEIEIIYVGVGYFGSEKEDPECVFINKHRELLYKELSRNDNYFNLNIDLVKGEFNSIHIRNLSIMTDTVYINILTNFSFMEYLSKYNLTKKKLQERFNQYFSDKLLAIKKDIQQDMNNYNCTPTTFWSSIAMELNINLPCRIKIFYNELVTNNRRNKIIIEYIKLFAIKYDIENYWTTNDAIEYLKPKFEYTIHETLFNELRNHGVGKVDTINRIFFMFSMSMAPLMYIRVLDESDYIVHLFCLMFAIKAILIIILLQMNLKNVNFIVIMLIINIISLIINNNIFVAVCFGVYTAFLFTYMGALLISCEYVKRMIMTGYFMGFFWIIIHNIIFKVNIFVVLMSAYLLYLAYYRFNYMKINISNVKITPKYNYIFSIIINPYIYFYSLVRYLNDTPEGILAYKRVEGFRLPAAIFYFFFFDWIIRKKYKFIDSMNCIIFILIICVLGLEFWFPYKFYNVRYISNTILLMYSFYEFFLNFNIRKLYETQIITLIMIIIIYIIYNTEPYYFKYFYILLIIYLLLSFSLYFLYILLNVYFVEIDNENEQEKEQEFKNELIKSSIQSNNSNQKTSKQSKRYNDDIEEIIDDKHIIEEIDIPYSINYVEEGIFWNEYHSYNNSKTKEDEDDIQIEVE